MQDETKECCEDCFWCFRQTAVYVCHAIYSFFRTRSRFPWCSGCARDVPPGRFTVTIYFYYIYLLTVKLSFVLRNSHPATTARTTTGSIVDALFTESTNDPPSNINKAMDWVEGIMEDSYRATDEKKELENSELTPATETTGSVCDEDAGWFADFRTLAISLKETAGGIASLVQRSAAAVANEISQLEQDEMGPVDVDEKNLTLPWEIEAEGGDFHVDDELKEKISELGARQSTFLLPFSRVEQIENEFVLDDKRIRLIRNLLEQDENLAASHAKLSGRSNVKEILFWRNYFHAIDILRTEHLQKNEYHRYETNQTYMDMILSPGDDCKDDEISFVCIPSPPTSMNSTGIRSIDSMVLVENYDNAYDSSTA